MSSKPSKGDGKPDVTLVDIDELVAQYYSRKPDIEDPQQLIRFGTSGHRGSSLDGTFTESHVHAVTQAICDYRRRTKVDGPLMMGKDTHALSGPAQRSALEVLAANAVETLIQERDGYTPTPAISRAILSYNRDRTTGKADGIIITPSHNPPGDGGFKYNPPHGGPAHAEATSWIQNRANELLRDPSAIKTSIFEVASRADTTHETDFAREYIEELRDVVDMDSIRAAGVRIGADPLGGAAVEYWGSIAEVYRLDVTVTNDTVDPQFAFMPLDHDGKIRMDCSSKHAMANLIRMKGSFDVACGNDPDADRHGIVTRSAGLMNPNHFLAVAIQYLLTHRDQWPITAAVGKTVVSSSLIDRVAAALKRRLVEIPVGFKWFVDGLLRGELALGGEESAGASFLRRDGTVWTTDKDGLIMSLLAAEITACTDKDPGDHYREITARLGEPLYRRVDEPATHSEKQALSSLTADAVTASTLAGERIQQKLTRASGNDAPIGGLKVVAESGWFAARPSGTEDLYKIYAESFRDETHLDNLLDEARRIVSRAFREFA